MSKIDDQKRYITLEDVRVSYKKKDDSIHLTSPDPDIAIEGFHMFLRKGTHTETVLRGLLEDAGIILKGEAPKTIERGSLDTCSNNSNKAPIITITSPEGGSGKTTIALNLAIQLSKLTNPLTGKKFKVFIADFAGQNGRIGTFIKQSLPTILNYYISPERTDKSLQENVTFSAELGIYALLAPKQSKTNDLFTTEFYTETLQKLSNSFDIVIVDSADDPTVRNATLPMSNAILCVVPGRDPAGLPSLDRWICEIQAEGGNLDKVSFIANKWFNSAKNNKALEFFQTEITYFKTPVVIFPHDIELIQIDSPAERKTFLNTKNEYTAELLRLAKQLAGLTNP